MKKYNHQREVFIRRNGYDKPMNCEQYAQARFAEDKTFTGGCYPSATIEEARTGQAKLGLLA